MSVSWLAGEAVTDYDAVMARLFDDPAAPKQPVDPHARVVAVAIGANVWKTFDYVWPAGLGEAVVGQRVMAPFGRGNRKTVGVVVGVDRPPGERELKAVAESFGARGQLSERLLELGRWISEYYLAPLGPVL
ncbi:MAG: primosomal protein N' family DNA-binding protein, partial [Planctomycetota bacterium]